MKMEKYSRRTLEYKGKAVYLSDLSKMCGVHSATITTRLKHGWTLEDAMSKPAKKLKPRGLIDFKGKEWKAVDLAKEYRVSVLSFRARYYYNGWTLEEALEIVPREQFLKKDNKSGYTGVYFKRQENRWVFKKTTEVHRSFMTREEAIEFGKKWNDDSVSRESLAFSRDNNDWKAINEYYHSARDITLKGCMKKFGFCGSSWVNALKRGDCENKDVLKEFGKICSKCKTSDQSLFSKSGSVCRECQSKSAFKYRRENMEQLKLKEKQKISGLRKYVDDIKDKSGCSKCGEMLPSVCLDFHHLQDKKFGISKGVSNGYAIKRIKLEIDKCIIICANCHRKLHDSEKTESD